MSVTEAASGRPLLLHAHPGHELRLFGWMEQHKPTLFLMTDGSGGGVSRTHHSLEIVKRTGACAGAAFGLAPDRDWYAAVLAGDQSLFGSVIEAVVHAATALAATRIVSDAVDGYNPMHDLCEVVAASAVAVLKSRGHAVEHLVARAVSGGDDTDVVSTIRLDRQTLVRKQSAIESYMPLAEEVRRLLQEEPDALACERLRRPTFAWGERWSPSWENIGASRVAASKYAQRIEYLSHVRPLALALLGERVHARSVEHSERLDCAS